MIKNRNKMRRKYQRTNNPLYEQHRNIFTSTIQKRIILTINKTWQKKLANIENTDPTFWETYKISGGSTNKIPIPQDAMNNTIHYTNEEKAESLAKNFELVHLNTCNTHSPIEQEIEHKATVIRKTSPTQKNTLSCTHKLIKEIIKEFSKNKAPIQTRSPLPN